MITEIKIAMRNSHLWGDAFKPLMWHILTEQHLQECRHITLFSNEAPPSNQSEKAKPRALHTNAKASLSPKRCIL